MGGGGREVEWGNELPISLHYLAQGEGQGGGGVCSLPLCHTHTQLHGHPPLPPTLPFPSDAHTEPDYDNFRMGKCLRVNL